MSAFTNRIRRIILGPTEAELNAEAVAAGLPGYPIPPIPTQSPTNLNVAPSPTVRPVGGAWVFPHDEIYDQEPLILSHPDRAAASAAIAHARHVAPPAIICDTCTHAAHMHPDEEAEQLAPSCIGEGPGYACPCTHTCQQINGFDVPAHTYRPAGDTVPTSPAEFDPTKYPLHDDQRRPDRDNTDIDVPVSAPPARPAPPAATPTTNSGVHHLDAAPETLPSVRAQCTTCGGHGYVERTVNDLLNESLSLIPKDSGDQVIREFYTRLLTAAPHLARLFPDDLLNAAVGDGSPGAMQRDRLLNALVALADLYGAGTDAMNRLNTELARFGRSHTGFVRPDGSVQDATVAEYLAVKDVLLGTLADGLGASWRPEYGDAWSEAFDHAMVEMLHAQHVKALETQARGAMTAPRFPRRSGDHA